MMFVLQVQTKKELDVKREVNKLSNCAALVPMRIERIRKEGIVTRQTKILFTGYVFVDAPLTNSLYYHIRDIPGVVRFLGDGQPKQLSANEVEYIEWLNNKGQPIGLSDVDVNGNIVSGPLMSKKKSVIKIDRRNRKAKVQVPFAGEIREISLGIRLLQC